MQRSEMLAFQEGEIWKTEGGVVAMMHESTAYINKILLELSDEISFEYDLATDTMLFSEKYKQVYRRKNKIVHFIKESTKRYVLLANSVSRLEDLKRVTNYGETTSFMQIQWPNKNGKYEWCEVVYRHIKGQDGSEKAVGIWRNIDRSKREQVMLKYQLVTEQMEGVENRVGIEQHIEKELKIADSMAALYLLDFDNMKQLKTTYGMLAVEELLHMYAKELLVHFHEDGLVGHLGSDKFVVYIRQVKDKEMAKILAKRMKKIISGLCENLHMNQAVTVTIGIALLQSPITYKEALEQVDAAVRYGKNNGKNQYVFFDEKVQEGKYLKLLTISKLEKNLGKSLGKLEKNKKIYDAGKIWPDLLECLYKNADIMENLEAVIAFVGKVFHLDKVMVWEYDTDQDTISNTLQWAKKGLHNTREQQQKINFKDSEINYVHNAEGLFYCTSLESMPPRMQEYAAREGFQALLEARVFGEADSCLGLIDFAMCHGRVWVQEEIDLLLLVSKVIGEVMRRKHMTEKMEQYYGNTRNILDNVVTGIFVIDQETKEIYYHNDALRLIFPCLVEQLKQGACKGLSQCSHCENTDCDNLQELCKKENHMGKDGFVIEDNKTGRAFELMSTKMLWENTRHAYIVTVNEHIDSPEELERKRRQEYLEKRYAFIYSHSCDCIFDIDVENDWYDLTIVNEGSQWPGLEKHGNYSKLVSSPAHNMIVEEDRTRFDQHFSLQALRQNIAQGEKLIVDSFVVKSRNGNLHSKEIRAFILEEDGRCNVVATYCDITEQRRNEMQMVLERQKLTRAVVNVYPIVISANVTTNEYVVMANEHAFMNLDNADTRLSAILLDFAMKLHPDDRDSFMAKFDREHMKNHFQTGKNKIGADVRFQKEGAYFWISIACIRIDNPLNEDLLVYIFVRNIDKQKTMQQNLKDALNAAERASDAKSEFLSRMSHEIRTPMNAIIGMAELAKNKVADARAMETYLTKIDDSAHYLLSLINNVLDMSRIESKKVVIEKKEFRMEELLETIGNIIIPQANAKGIRFEIQQAQSFSSTYIGDPLRLNQIFINLLSNALKFTAAGGTITLGIKESRQEGNASYIAFSVADTGEGMSQEFMQHMYEPFEQEYANSAEGMKGTGLGLSITKNLITLMNGHIKCKSQKGEGTTFLVELKLEKVDRFGGMWINHTNENKPVDKEEIKKLAGKRILMAEDNALNREIAVTMLEMLEMQVDCVENGDLAVQKILEMGSDYYDLILMDIRMPVKNGLDASADIRAIGTAYAKDIPILALSANAFEEDKTKAFANGMTDYLVKPIDINILNAMLVKYIQ